MSGHRRSDLELLQAKQKSREVKVLAVLEYVFHGSRRRVSKVLSIAIEPISKSTVHDLARKVSSMVTVASEPRYRRCIAVDETKLRVKGATVYVWSAVDVDSGELLALEASYGRSCLNAFEFLKKALKKCLNKPRVIVDRGPWYRWALQRLGLEYEHQRFGMRNRVGRFFRYLKERTSVFHNKLSARNYEQGIRNLNLFLNLFTLYYQTIRNWGWIKMLIRTLSLCLVA